MTELKLVFPEAREWRYIMESLATIIDEANIIATEEGLSLRALDPGRIAMVEFDMSSTVFEEYEVGGEVKIGVNFDDFNRVLRRAKAGDKLELAVEDGKLVVVFLGRVERRFTLPLLDIEGQELPKPQLNLTVDAAMLSDTFRDALRDAGLVSESVRLKAEDDKLVLSARSDIGEMETIFSKEDGSLIDIDVREPAEASYGLDRLLNILGRASRVSEIVKIGFGNDYPLSLIFEVPGGYKLCYVVAPRAE